MIQGRSETAARKGKSNSFHSHIPAEGALGIARERQSNLEGYDERRAAERDAQG